LLGIVDAGRECMLVENYVAQLGVKAPGIDTSVETLSGGNQQKVILGKWLNASPTIFILDEPTRGIDIGAKVEIYKLLDRLAGEGVAIIMVSSELPEVLGMSDRILVMREGAIVAEFSREEATREAIMEYATGARRTGE
jgi:D-xylose transport system ATP-binding protein